jgi:hypothetical protein
MDWEPLKELFSRSANFFLNFLGAIVIFVVGWLIAKIIRFIIERVLRAIRLDSIAEQLKVSEFLAKGGIKLALSEIIGLVVYWIIILGVVISSLNLLQLTGVASFLYQILGYVPIVIGALVVLVLGIFISVFVGSIVRTATANLGVSQADLLGKIAQVTIISLTILIALNQLEIGQILTDTVKILLATIGLAAALAFGLGCREVAGKFTEEVIEKLKKK